MAQEIVRQADALYPRMANAKLSEAEDLQFRSQFSFESFRRELDWLLAETGLPRFEEDEWTAFLLHFLRVIQDCPLSCKATDSELRHVDEVVLISESGNSDVHSEETPPPIIWSLHFDGVEKFNVPGSLTARRERS
jgi:hypothetical protein